MNVNYPIFSRTLFSNIFAVNSPSPRRQCNIIERKYKTQIKLVHDLHGTWLQYNTKKLGTNPTLVGSCGGQIVSRTSRDVFIFNSGLRFEELFWERCIFCRAKLHLDSIEDFNLEHRF